MKIYKYMVEGELCNLEKIDKSYFTDYINKLSIKQNALVREDKKGIYWYYCTNCKKWHKDVKFNVKTHKKCPYCKHKYKVITKRNIIPKYEDYITVLEKNERNELIIRLFYFKRIYDKHSMDFQIACIEVERINFDREIYMKMNTYSNMGYITHNKNGKITRDRPYRTYYGWRSFGELYPYTNVITSGIKKLLRNTKYKYSCLDIVARKHIDIHDYLIKYRKYEKMELLVKNKNFNLIRDIIKIDGFPDELLKKENLKHLKWDLNLKEFKNACCFKLNNLRDIRIYTHLDGSERYQSIAKLNSNIDKAFHYVYDQKRDLIFYRDYLTIAKDIGYDMNNNNVLYPKDLLKAHDEAVMNYTKNKDKITNKKINERYMKLQKFKFQKNHFVIFPVKSPEELIIESQELKHCVRTYVDRVANGKTNIFFVRKDNDIEKPFVTVEMKNGTVIQARGYKNNIENPLEENVKNFINAWCNKFHLKSCF